MLPSLSFRPSASGDGPKLPLGIDRGEPKTRNWSMINDPLQNSSPEIRISSPPKTLRILRISKFHQALVPSVIQAIASHSCIQWQKPPTRRWKRLTIGWVESTRHLWLPRISNQELQATTKRIDRQATKKIPMHCTQFCRQPTRSPTSHRLDTRKLLPASSHLYQSEKPWCPAMGLLRHVFLRPLSHLKSDSSSRTTRKHSLWNL